MESEILSFYKDKTVFITGGTGFLGKVIIEKLLRVTDVERIYFLVRTKRGEGVKERFEAWKKDQIFKVLLEDRPQAMEHVTPIAGDCSEVDLGISEGDRRILTTEVQVIIHGAASVRFMEPLQDALNINTRSVRLMVQLAKEMRRLEAFLHISTAFSNCVVTHTQERFYPEHLTCSSDKVLELNESLSTELVNKMAPALLGRFPNTYTYTKALGEQVIQEEAADLPVGIFRPAIIFSIFKEPLPGWVDGLQGIGGMIYGSAYGILHLVLINGKANASIVPADYCVNVAIATPVQIAKKASQPKKSVPPIFTFAPCQSNEITYNEIIEHCYINAMPVPNTKMIWYPFTHRTNCPWLFSVGIYLYHMLPALLLDMVLRLKGKKPVMIKTYHKVHEGVRLLYPFSKQSFTMETNNTDQLWQSMTPTDKRIFHFDMANLSWVDYFSASMYGMRLYLFKDLPTPESVAKGKRILNRYYLWDRTIKFVLFVLLGTFIWYLFKLAFN